MENLDLKYKEIYPKIFVYTNLFPDHKSLHTIMKKSENESQGKGVYSKWTDWFVFGKYCSSRYYKFIIQDIKESFDNGISYDFDLYEQELLLHIRLNEAVTAAISNYVAINDVTLPENSSNRWIARRQERDESLDVWFAACQRRCSSCRVRAGLPTL